MSDLELDAVALGKVGMMRQTQPEFYVMRLHAVAGDLTARQIRCIARVAARYGRGSVHLSTRQGVEIHYVRQEDLEKARLELLEGGVEMGACGPRVRLIVACPGNETCRQGVIDTKTMTKTLDERYFKTETPSKFKMSVAGCSNNCSKATENDIGIRGAIEPEWVPASCSDCGLCMPLCPVRAISRRESGGNPETPFRYEADEASCINCSTCTSLCPSDAWRVGKRGYHVYIGGTMGRVPRFASLLKKFVTDEEDVYRLVEEAIAFYRQHGNKKERFGHMIDRIGLDTVREVILGSV
ncbi:4Fe-4S dicluster domain-containing protein [Chlorobium sp.]|uniref:4Fe-4S dicluster domain-containing protein n=1 Tax=Chlorobium sp. TaxID=1095 RepID=UPI003C3D0F99